MLPAMLPESCQKGSGSCLNGCNRGMDAANLFLAGQPYLRSSHHPLQRPLQCKELMLQTLPLAMCSIPAKMNKLQSGGA